MRLRFVIDVAPTTKKTSNRTFDVGHRCAACKRGARTIVMPSELFEDFERAVAPALHAVYAKAEPSRVPCALCEATGKVRGKRCLRCGGAQVSARPITAPVLVEALFYRQRAVGDLVGYQQAIADVLETAGAVENDRQIVGWPLPTDGGLSLRKDAARPRIELVVSVVEVAGDQPSFLARDRHTSPCTTERG